MRGFQPAGATADHVAGADRVALLADAQFAFAGEDEEHFFIGVMIVERKRGLPGGDNDQAVSQFLGADAAADVAKLGLVFFARVGFAGPAGIVAPGAVVKTVDIHNRRRHLFLPTSYRR